MAKNLPACPGEVGLITGSGRYPGGGGGNPLQYSCLQNPTDRSLADYVHGDPRVRDLATTTTSALHIKGGKEKEKTKLRIELGFLGTVDETWGMKRSIMDKLSVTCLCSPGGC